MQNNFAILVTDPNYDVSMYRLTKRLLESNPPFDMTNLDDVTDKCRESSQIFIDDLQKFKLWALRSEYAKFCKSKPDNIINSYVIK